jgi:hypothetical protein
MLSKGFADLNRLKARATELLPPDAKTTLYELVSLLQEAAEILHGWGPTYRDIRLAIEALDFNSDALASYKNRFHPDAPSSYKNRPITPDTQPSYGPNRYNQERHSAYLSEVLKRYIRLIEVAQRLKQTEDNTVGPTRSTTPTRGEKKVSRLGRPRDVKLNQALTLLKQGMRKNKEEHPDTRERWEWLFDNQVCPQCIPNWANLEEDKRKKYKKNMRSALLQRGGTGRPPERNSK